MPGTGMTALVTPSSPALTTSLSGGRERGRIDAHARETDELVRSEASKHRHALAQVITWATLAIIYCATAVAIAGRVGIPVTSLAAPAAVVDWDRRGRHLAGDCRADRRW
jgi:moderate conductance mechanosensitive channel